VDGIEVSLAGTGQGKPAVMANKQWRVQIVFQLAYLLADSGLGDFKVLCRPSKSSGGGRLLQKFEEYLNVDVSSAVFE